MARGIRRARDGGRGAFSWDAVLKIGGSLHGSPRLRELLGVLAGGARTRHLLIVPGGGPFADTVRESWRRLRLSEEGAHRMALLAMDQYGLLLCDLEPRAEPVTTLGAARRVARGGKLPILLAAKLAAAAPGLPASWSVTSDSVAAWVAQQVRARRLVLLKSVQVPRPSSAVPVRNLVEAGILDRAFATVCTAAIPVWIANGREPQEVARLLDGDERSSSSSSLTRPRGRRRERYTNPARGRA